MRRILPEPKALRHDLLCANSADVKRRRAIIGASLVGLGGMAAVTMLQTGLIKHLPDPPLRGFDSDKINLSDDAYRFGAPDGTLSLASLAINLPLAAFGGRDRLRRWPWTALFAAGKAAFDAVAAAWYFRLMPAKKTWCAYCIIGAASNFTILLLSVPEARRAWALLHKSNKA